MGVDIETYRGRIGTFKFALGTDVVILECFINFSYGLKSVCAVMFIGMLLLMAGIEPNPGPITTGDSQEEENCTTIMVSGIPPDVDETHLTLVFKNTKKQGGGKVKSVQLNKEERTALVEFEDPKAVQMVLMKRPIKIANCEVGVEAVATSQCTIEVQGFPMIDSIQELLELYFEDEEFSGGDTIVEIKLIADGKALVTYETEEVARRVAAKKTHIVKRPLTVTLYNGTGPGVDHSVKDQAVKELEKNTENLSKDEINTDIVHKEPTSTTPIRTESESQHLTESELCEALPKYKKTTEQVHTEAESSTQLPKDQTVKEPVLSELELCKPDDRIEFGKVERKFELDTPVLKYPISKEASATESELNEPMPKDQPVLEKVQRESFMCSPVSEGHTHIVSMSKESELCKSSPGKQNQAEPVSEESESVENDQSTGSGRSKQHEKVGYERSLLVAKETKGKHLSEESTLTIEDEDEEEIPIQSMLQKLGLLDKYPEKITIEDVTSISLKPRDEKIKDVSEVPWLLLRQIIGIQCKARDASTSSIELTPDQETVAVGLDDFLGDTAEDDELSPLDVFNLTLECCDKMLKQLLFKKLYLCKIAVPFLYKDRLSLKNKLSIWPLRSLVVFNKPLSQMEAKRNEFEVLELPLNTITFAHFGSTHFSKSKLINNLISDQIDDTFYHEDCRSGSARRSFSKSIIEFMCLPALGDNKDVFPDAVVFFNMRGKIETDFSEDVVTFVAKLSDVVAVVVDIEMFRKKKGILTKIISNFSHTVLIVDGLLESKDPEMLRLYSGQSSTPVTPVSTFKGKKKKISKKL